MTSATGGAAIILMAGSRWENTRGTDHRLAQALARHVPVLWVDPPVPASGPASTARPAFRPGYVLDEVSANVMRLRVVVVPGFTKPVLRSIARLLVGQALRRAVAERELAPVATLLMSPRETFPRGVPGPRLLHVTDDWPSGARLMGLARQHVENNLRVNLRTADAITVVSPQLMETIAALGHEGPQPIVLPNGCSIPGKANTVPERNRAAVGLIGQLNERLDLDLLDGLAATGMDMEVIGPRRERDPVIAARLDRFLGRPNVRWMGELTETELWVRLQSLAVGITPYLDNEFNRASFPLKTLDYLAAGLPVVSTGLPAVRWLNTPHIQVGATRERFISLVQQNLLDPPSADQREEHRAFARHLTWDARAEQLMGMLASEVTE